MAVKIVMVCLGNICRSPLAEGLLQSKLPKDKFIVDSAGTSNLHVGEKPDKRSVAVAHKYGITINQQRARHFRQADFDNFDYIYVMDQFNYKNVMAIAPDELGKSKVKMILNELYPNQNRDVPDPYYGEADGFEAVFEMLDNACAVIAQKLLSQHPL